MANAQAQRGEEGRSERRNATGSSKQATIRRYPNGATHQFEELVSINEYIVNVKETQRTETSKYLEEKKAKAIPRVVASEIGTAQTTGRNICEIGRAHV